MVAYNKFETFVGDIGAAVHDLDANLIKVYLTNNAPSTSLDSIKTDLVEISAGNGYTAGGDDVSFTYSETTGTGTGDATDNTWTASGGSIGPFQYAILYNDTPASPLDPLIAWWDNGSGITLANGESFTTKFGADVFTFV